MHQGMTYTILGNHMSEVGIGKYELGVYMYALCAEVYVFSMNIHILENQYTAIRNYMFAKWNILTIEYMRITVICILYIENYLRIQLKCISHTAIRELFIVVIMYIIRICSADFTNKI